MRRRPPAGRNRFLAGPGGKNVRMTQPTDTPPAAGQTEMVRHEHSNDANSGPVVPNRTPMVIGLSLIALIVVCTLLLIVGRIVID